MSMLKENMRLAAEFSKEVIRHGEKIGMVKPIVSSKKLKFNSQVCTKREQSEKIMALGLKKETADLKFECYGIDADGKPMHLTNPKINYSGVMTSADIPAWSLHRLLIMCDSDVQTDGHYFCLPHYGFTVHDNIFDNICDCIARLIKKGCFNKDYLEKSNNA